MAYDGFMTAAVLSEMKNSLEGSKIEKITQPESDRVVMHTLQFNYQGISQRLLMAEQIINYH